MNNKHTNISITIGIHTPESVHVTKRLPRGQIDIGRLKTFMHVYGYNANHLAFVTGTTPEIVSEKLDEQRPFWASELSDIEAFLSLDNGELLIKS